MNRYVKRENITTMFDRYFHEVEELYKAGECNVQMLQLVLDMKQAFFELPATSGVEYVTHAYWCEDEDHNAYESAYFCSNCLADGSDDIRGENYCYNCGAKMDARPEDCTCTNRDTYCYRSEVNR